MYKRVLIVREGNWGSVPREDYEHLIENYCHALEGAKDSQGNSAAKVTVVDTVEEAERKLSMEVDIIVFNSRGMVFDAERIAQKYPRVRVVVITGLIPEGKVVWVNKARLQSLEAIRKAFLDW